MVRDGDAFYLFYSTDLWWTSGYRVGVRRCVGVSGPCNQIFSTAVLASRGAMLGPGGQTPFRDNDGEWHMLFHAWTSPAVGYQAGGARTMRLLPLAISGNEVKVG
jgi:hypothetical protein